MRTTLTIDDDVLLAARSRARREGRSVGSVLSELARMGLAGREVSRVDPTEGVLGFRPLPPGDRIVTNELIDSIRDEEGI